MYSITFKDPYPTPLHLGESYKGGKENGQYLLDLNLVLG